MATPFLSMPQGTPRTPPAQTEAAAVRPAPRAPSAYAVKPAQGAAAPEGASIFPPPGKLVGKQTPSDESATPSRRPAEDNQWKNTFLGQHFGGDPWRPDVVAAVDKLNKTPTGIRIAVKGGHRVDQVGEQITLALGASPEGRGEAINAMLEAAKSKRWQSMVIKGDDETTRSVIEAALVGGYFSADQLSGNNPKTDRMVKEVADQIALRRGDVAGAAVTPSGASNSANSSNPNLVDRAKQQAQALTAKTTEGQRFIRKVIDQQSVYPRPVVEDFNELQRAITYMEENEQSFATISMPAHEIMRKYRELRDSDEVSEDLRKGFSLG